MVQASSSNLETSGYRSAMKSIAEASSSIVETAGYRSAMESIAQASNTIAESAGYRELVDAANRAVEQTESAEPVPTAPEEVEGAPSLLDGLIAVGLAGRDLAINSTTLAWLITIRQVRRACGSAAARKVAVIMMATALTVVGILWSAADGEVPGTAVFTGLSCLVAVLALVLPSLGGE